jgi:carbon monoxide dehydrogenase subunit G
VQLRNTFPVPADPDEAFTALLDLERVAPCMPGAQLTGSEGDAYHGRLKLRIGPITAAYEGTVTVEDADREQRRAHLTAAGHEIGGQGAASAKVTATIRRLDDGLSEVEVVTDVDIRGKAAQFGRGALGEVTQRVLDQFARNLEATFVSSGQTAPSGPEGASPAPSRAGSAAAPEVADLDVLRSVVLPMASRAAPAVMAFVVGVLLGRLGRRTSQPPSPWATWGPPPPAWGPPRPRMGTPTPAVARGAIRRPAGDVTDTPRASARPARRRRPRRHPMDLRCQNDEGNQS